MRGTARHGHEFSEDQTGGELTHSTKNHDDFLRVSAKRLSSACTLRAPVAPCDRRRRSSPSQAKHLGQAPTAFLRQTTDQARVPATYAPWRASAGRPPEEASGARKNSESFLGASLARSDLKIVNMVDSTTSPEPQEPLQLI